MRRRRRNGDDNNTEGCCILLKREDTVRHLFSVFAMKKENDTVTLQFRERLYVEGSSGKWITSGDISGMAGGSPEKPAENILLEEKDNEPVWKALQRLKSCLTGRNPGAFACLGRQFYGSEGEKEPVYYYKIKSKY